MDYNFYKFFTKQVIKIFVQFNQIMLNIKLGYYKYIGSGSGRYVFDLGNGYVVKLSKNEAGIAQNKSEYKISSNINSDLFAKVVSVSNDFMLLIMEKAISINDISYVYKYFHVNNINELVKMKGLKNIVSKYNLLMSDLNKKSSWGLIDGQPTIIDYGFTKTVKQKYY